jgi:ribosomal protein L34E
LLKASLKASLHSVLSKRGVKV